MLDEHISWIDHVRTVENKVAENFGLLCRLRQFLLEDSLKIYFLYIHSYLKYCMDEYVCNEIEKSLFETKHAVHIVFDKDKLTNSKHLFENLNTSNVYQINI